jgi:hypothetical protein
MSILNINVIPYNEGPRDVRQVLWASVTMQFRVISLNYLPLIAMSLKISYKDNVWNSPNWMSLALNK